MSFRNINFNGKAGPVDVLFVVDMVSIFDPDAILPAIMFSNKLTALF